MSKPATQWFTPNRNGTVTIGDNDFLVTNSAEFIVTNSGSFIVTNTLTPVPEPRTSWTESTKNDTSWISIGFTIGSVYDIADPSSNTLADPSGNTVVDTGNTLNVINPASWTED